MTSNLIISKIDNIQFELESLKKLVNKVKRNPSTAKSLCGIIKGIEISDDEIEEAKMKIFKTEL